MITSLRHAGLRTFFETGSKAGIVAQHAPKLRRILGVLDAAQTIDQVNLPGLRLHKLTGNLAGFGSVTVNGNWRVIFRFETGDAGLVDYLDYH